MLEPVNSLSFSAMQCQDAQAAGLPPVPPRGEKFVGRIMFSSTKAVVPQRDWSRVHCEGRQQLEKG